jgi:DNA polymerase-3 subunit beta
MLKVNTKQLKDAVNQSLSNNSFPNVLLKTSNNTLKVCSIDSDSYLVMSVDIEQKDSELISLVDRKQLSNILKTIKTDHIDLTMEDKNLIINTDKAVYRLQSKDPNLFNHYGMDTDINDGITLNSKTLIDAIDRVMYAVSKDRNRYSYYDNLKTVGFIFEAGSFYVAGTDGNRLAMCDLKLPNRMNNRFGIPKSAASHLKKLLKKDVLFNVIESEYQKIAVLKSDNFVFTTIINDNLPDIIGAINGYREYLAIEVKLSKDAIIDILKSFVIDKKETYTIRLTLTNDNLNLLSLVNNSSANIPVDYTGDKYTINFNALYLLEALENICSNDVILKLPSSNDYAAYIEPVNNCGCLALVMPLG